MKNKTASFLIAESIISLIIFTSLVVFATTIQNKQLEKLKMEYKKMIEKRVEIENHFKE